MVIIGWLNIYAAVYNEEHTGLFDFSQRYGKQFIWIVATLVIAMFVVVVDTRFYFFFSYFHSQFSCYGKAGNVSRTPYRKYFLLLLPQWPVNP